MRLRIISAQISVIFLIITLVGCEAFIKKFTRKPKNETPATELVLTPEEFKGPGMSNEELYRQFYTFWKSWQDELIESLLQKRSNKKVVDCAQEAIKNMVSMKSLLIPEKQALMEKYIEKMANLLQNLKTDIYSANYSTYRERADYLRMNIVRNFSFPDIKGSIK